MRITVHLCEQQCRDIVQSYSEGIRKMRYAETGFDLEIDLSRGSIDKVATDRDFAELYFGGQGAAAKLLWDRVPPGTDPFSADNLLIFSTGLLHGTPVPSANRTCVNTFSPQTNLMSHSLFGGFFGPELKYAGYDRIIIRGKAPDLVYLYINNDKVEIRDATHLRAKGTTETGDQLKRELKDQKVQVAAIGLAGENRVFMASIDHNHFAWGNARTRRKDFWSAELQERWTRWKHDHMDRQTGCYNCPKKCRN